MTNDDRTPIQNPIRISDFYAWLCEQDTNGRPWVVWARWALAHGWWCGIPSRHNAEILYLARFWMTMPFVGTEGGDCPWESSDSILLHYFAQPDDDGALHDHPWEFTTRVLSGGYQEATPGPDWIIEREETRHRTMAGPGIDERIISHYSGAIIEHGAESLHSVVGIHPDTWTLVCTKARVRPWGFHPPGDPWVPFSEFLDRDPQGAGKHTP